MPRGKLPNIKSAIRNPQSAIPTPAPRRIIFAGLVIVVVTLAACERADRTEDRRDASAKVGRQAPATRIITIAPNSAEILCAIGACDSIVGVSKYCIYPPRLSDRPRVGGLFDPDLERIISLQPDLVVLRGRNDEVERLCDAGNIAVYHDPTERLADIETCILDLGRRVGKEEEAAALIRGFHGRIDAIRARVARVVGDAQRPKVLVTLARNPQELADCFTAGAETYVSELLDIAGGENLFGHVEMDYPTVSMEEVLTRQPEVILEFMPEVTVTADLRRQMVAQWAKVGPTPALVNGRIYFVGDELDHSLIPSPRYVEVIDAVSRILHPDEE